MKEATSQPLTSEELAVIRSFAGQAMQALITHDGLNESEAVREEYALWSYRMAQAMLATEKRLKIRQATSGERS